MGTGKSFLWGEEEIAFDQLMPEAYEYLSCFCPPQGRLPASFPVFLLIGTVLPIARKGGGSRGSALYTCPDGRKPGEKMPDLYCCRLDEGKLKGMLLHINGLFPLLSASGFLQKYDPCIAFRERKEREGSGICHSPITLKTH